MSDQIVFGFDGVPVRLRAPTPPVPAPEAIAFKAEYSARKAVDPGIILLFALPRCRYAAFFGDVGPVRRAVSGKAPFLSEGADEEQLSIRREDRHYVLALLAESGYAAVLVEGEDG